MEKIIMLDLELIKAYIKMKQVSERFLPHEWRDEELDGLMIGASQRFIKDLSKMLKQAVDSTFFKCIKCGHNMRISTSICRQCRWENPLAQLGLAEDVY